MKTSFPRLPTVGALASTATLMLSLVAAPQAQTQNCSRDSIVINQTILALARVELAERIKALPRERIRCQEENLAAERSRLMQQLARNERSLKKVRQHLQRARAEQDSVDISRISEKKRHLRALRNGLFSDLAKVGALCSAEDFAVREQQLVRLRDIEIPKLEQTLRQCGFPV